MSIQTIQNEIDDLRNQLATDDEMSYDEAREIMWQISFLESNLAIEMENFDPATF
jgi:hypothetical protein